MPDMDSGKQAVLQGTGAVAVSQEHVPERPATTSTSAAPSSTLSSRGLRGIGPPIPYFDLFMQAWKDPWSPENPNGKIILCVAENKLTYRKLLAPKLQQLAAASFEDPTNGVANYGLMRGWPRLRAAVAKLMSKRLCPGHEVDPEHLTIFNGVGALLDLLSSILFEAGDVVLVPAPYYAAFDNDLVVRSGARLVQFDLQGPSYDLTKELLDAAEEAAKKQGASKIAGLLLTTPHNPLGITFSAEGMAAARRWCSERHAHLISDEIYGASVYRKGGDGPGYTSAAHPAVCPDGVLGDRTHVLWGFSKDFCVSGFRVGVLYTQSKELLQALETLALFVNVGHPTQDLLARVLEDEDFVSTFLEANCDVLLSTCEKVERYLKDLAIPYVQPKGGMFLWMDLRELLNSSTPEGEAELNRTLYEEAGLVLTPGLAQHAAEAGWYRICFAYVAPEALEVAMERLSALVRKKRQGTPAKTADQKK